MRYTITSLLAAGVVLAWPPEASPQGARFWFSRAGADEFEPISGTPSDFVDFDNGGIPYVVSDVASVDLFVWGTLGVIVDRYSRLSFDVNVYPTAGDVWLANSYFYQGVDTNGAQRWSDIWQGTRTQHNLDDSVLTGFNRRGFSESPPYDVQYDPATRSLLLGVITLAMTPGAQADIFFGVGTPGFDAIPDIYDVYFGWGDGLVDRTEWGLESTFADAKIVPEPATVATILAAAGLLRLRRPRSAERGTG
ncbi:MAG: hypothetical protein CHACPFDD_00118 [Phycisphaerae bacterium]|nr:hypothetical protein [Phycisphaerae bacterium]